jgi:hypothetical protein
VAVQEALYRVHFIHCHRQDGVVEVRSTGGQEHRQEEEREQAAKGQAEGEQAPEVAPDGQRDRHGDGSGNERLLEEQRDEEQDCRERQPVSRRREEGDDATEAVKITVSFTSRRKPRSVPKCSTQSPCVTRNTIISRF